MHIADMRTELILRNFWKQNDKNQIELVRGIDLVLIFYSRPVAEQEEDPHCSEQLLELEHVNLHTL